MKKLTYEIWIEQPVKKNNIIRWVSGTVACECGNNFFFFRESHCFCNKCLYKYTYDEWKQNYEEYLGELKKNETPLDIRVKEYLKKKKYGL